MFELVSGKAELITILEGGRQGPRSVSVILFLASDTVFVQLNQYSQILRRQCWLTGGGRCRRRRWVLRLEILQEEEDHQGTGAVGKTWNHENDEDKNDEDVDDQVKKAQDEQGLVEAEEEPDFMEEEPLKVRLELDTIGQR